MVSGGNAVSGRGGAEGEVQETAWCILPGSVWEPAAIFPASVESHVVLLIPRPSAVGLICLENWEQGAAYTKMFLLNFNMPYLRGLVSAVSSQN